MTKVFNGMQNIWSELELVDYFYLAGTVIGLVMAFLAYCHGSSEITWFGLNWVSAFFLTWSLLFALFGVIDHYAPIVNGKFEDMFSLAFTGMIITGIVVLLPFYAIPGLALEANQELEKSISSMEYNCHRIKELHANGKGMILIEANGNLMLQLDNDDRFLFETSRLDDGREQCKLIKEFRKYDEFN